MPEDGQPYSEMKIPNALGGAEKLFQPRVKHATRDFAPQCPETIPTGKPQTTQKMRIISFTDIKDDLPVSPLAVMEKFAKSNGHSLGFENFTEEWHAAQKGIQDQRNDNWTSALEHLEKEGVVELSERVHLTMHGKRILKTFFRGVK